MLHDVDCFDVISVVIDVVGTKLIVIGPKVDPTFIPFDSLSWNSIGSSLVVFGDVDRSSIRVELCGTLSSIPVFMLSLRLSSVCGEDK